MTQLQLDRAVALVTGESRRRIAHLGFQLADPFAPVHDPEPYYDPEFHNYLDWDAAQEERIALWP